ncbi:SDR family NAD(P)-dependent oxidoreductase [Streptomyces triticagri]|uniref:SDR family NAD(P)-dependent oxidoreductase n=1 Tax=Streptomyces triticagri TaxID=2293568 RepID=A0A372LUE1_9ACTN|nr:SDR family oxidoreductase [Streptomyces triticagri]RFU82261.1 SDR family NAD(P)-dependent oxidoreductase [Streptomyces triticagri]
MRETAGTGHVAIVTGANQGIGAATARALAARGTAVLCTGLPLRPGDGAEPRNIYDEQRAAGLDHVVAAIRAEGGQAVALEADLAELATAGALFDHAEQHLGPVDILVNNASGWVQDTFTPDPVDRFDRVLRPVTPDTWAQQFAVDARAPALLIAELARRHRERGAHWGRIIGLTSGGDLGFPGEVSYGAAKAAQTDYTLSAAVELAPLGITANVVHPPVTDTGWVTDEVRRFVEASSTHFHVAEPADVARTIVHLASDDAALITGNVIVLR